MQPLTPQTAHWTTSNHGHWYRWRGYAVRWLLFGVVVHLYQPVDDIDTYWQQKLSQALLGLAFGGVGAVIFTLAENTVNHARTYWKSWVLVVATWLVVKVVFVSVLAAAGW